MAAHIGVSGLLCYACQNLLDNNRCTNVTQCSSSQACYGKEVQLNDGTLTYSTGCTDFKNCTSTGNGNGLTNIVGKRSSESSTNKMPCCTTNQCNDLAAIFTTTDTPKPCYDKDPDCATFGYDYICSADYKPWSTIHCAQYCGHCTATANLTTPTPNNTKLTTPTPTNTKLTTTASTDTKLTTTASTDTKLTTTASTDTKLTAPMCHDQDADCGTYGHDYICRDEYKPWASIHCAKYCGYCSDLTTKTPPMTHTATTQMTQTTTYQAVSRPCVDVDQDCATYGRSYICSINYIPWAKLHCAKYCGLC